jgi:hypothetical protein
MNNGLLPYLLTDPTVLGGLAWVGFGGTFIGLGIALWQISQAKGAADAAKKAVNRLSTAVHSRERLLDLTSTLRRLDNARNYLAQRDYSKAIVFLELAHGECVQARELVEEAEVKERIYSVVVRIAKLTEDVTMDDANGAARETAVQRGLEARAIADAINLTLARLRFRFAEDGTEQ